MINRIPNSHVGKLDGWWSPEAGYNQKKDSLADWDSLIDDQGAQSQMDRRSIEKASKKRRRGVENAAKSVGQVLKNVEEASKKRR